MHLNFVGVFPMAWVSGEPTNGRYLIVPPGTADYMHFRTKKQFTDLGEVQDNWIEFDVSRIPLNTCCEFTEFATFKLSRNCTY